MKYKTCSAALPLLKIGSESFFFFYQLNNSQPVLISHFPEIERNFLLYEEHFLNLKLALESIPI